MILAMNDFIHFFLWHNLVQFITRQNWKVIKTYEIGKVIRPKFEPQTNSKRNVSVLAKIWSRSDVRVDCR